MKANKERYEVILAGSGGQGLVLSGIILAEAAILEGNNVVQTVSYGIATRGGFSMAEVIIDKKEIIFQQVQNADIVLTFTDEAMEKFQSLLDKGTTIVYDTTLLKTQRGERLHGHPFTDMASKMCNVGMANIIALAYMAMINGMVGTESLTAVVKKRFSGKMLDMNLNALQAGIDLAVR